MFENEEMIAQFAKVIKILPKLHNLQLISNYLYKTSQSKIISGTNNLEILSINYCVSKNAVFYTFFEEIGKFKNLKEL